MWRHDVIDSKWKRKMVCGRVTGNDDGKPWWKVGENDVSIIWTKLQSFPMNKTDMKWRRTRECCPGKDSIQRKAQEKSAEEKCRKIEPMQYEQHDVLVAKG